MVMVEIKPQKYRFSIVFSTLFFPFTYPEVVDSLKERGYSVPPTPRPVPTGARVYVGGHIATKNGCIIDVDQDRKIIAGEGNQSDDLIKSVEDLIDITEKDFRLNLEKDVDYIELISDIIVRSNKSPIKAIESFGNNYDAFDEIMDMETSPYSISIVPKGFLPSSKKWFDIRIEPRLTLPDNDYFVHFVYRDDNVEGVLAFTGKVNSKLLLLIEKLEGM